MAYYVDRVRAGLFASLDEVVHYVYGKFSPEVAAAAYEVNCQIAVVASVSGGAVARLSTEQTRTKVTSATINIQAGTSVPEAVQRLVYKLVQLGMEVGCVMHGRPRLDTAIDAAVAHDITERLMFRMPRPKAISLSDWDDYFRRDWDHWCEKSREAKSKVHDDWLPHVRKQYFNRVW